jgi:Zn-dependent M28 family amino/carboxypeptidase
VPAEKVPPQVTVSVEDFNRVARNLSAGKPVRVAVEYKARESDGKTQWNTVAEIPGSELPNEVVYVGAHLDSWHSATGTTDNGVGSAAVMEAVRIIQASGLRPKRTIRVALWSGEEQGLLGSNAYVKEHYGHFDPPTTWGETRPTTRRLVKTDRHETVQAYFNLDNGTGKIRGLYAQGNPQAAAYFRTWLAEFKDLSASTVTLSDTGSTDHIAFDSVGIPGFQFIQDPIEYGTRTWHTNQDFYERAQAADLKQASTIMASVLWHVANMEGRFPRKAEPGR